LAFVTTAARLWKRLTSAEKLAASTHFWRETPEDVAGAAFVAMARARHMRPQAARALKTDERARILATLAEPGETVAAALLVALHLGERRPLLAAFLDSLGLPHEDGILKEEASQSPPPSADQAATALQKLLERFAPQEVATYLNTLWLQDPDHWHSLEALSDALFTAPAGPRREGSDDRPV
jgi:hypothetical protein